MAQLPMMNHLCPECVFICQPLLKMRNSCTKNEIQYSTVQYVNRLKPVQPRISSCNLWSSQTSERRSASEGPLRWILRYVSVTRCAWYCTLNMYSSSQLGCKLQPLVLYNTTLLDCKENKLYFCRAAFNMHTVSLASASIIAFFTSKPGHAARALPKSVTTSSAMAQEKMELKVYYN